MVIEDETLLVATGEETNAKTFTPENRFHRIWRAIARKISSQPGTTASLVMHASILVAIMFSVHLPFVLNGTIPSIVPVELVAIADRTNVAPVINEEDNFPEKEREIPPPPTTSQTVESAPVPDLELFPAPKIVATQSPGKKSDITNVTTSLDEHLLPSSGPKSARIGDENIKGVGAQTAMTMNLLDALRNQVAHCWKPPPGQPNSEQTAVTFELMLNPDGSVSRPPQESNRATTGNPIENAEAEAVRRAIYTCAPYSLPLSRYKEWRSTTLVFDLHLVAGLPTSYIYRP